MIQSFYNAASGMRAQQRNIDIVSNNIANINTTGYKKSKAIFKDALYGTLHDQLGRRGSVNLQRGSGVILSSTKRTFDTGHLVQTGNVFDVAIQGRGFFVVENENGERRYTEAGNFHLSQEQDGVYLVNTNGYYVIDNEGNRIRIEEETEDIVIDVNGDIYSQNGTQKIMVVDFSNCEGLESAGENLFIPTENSGETVIVDGAIIKQKYLEESNVNLTEEMINLIKAQRIYQINSKALQVADEMESITNNLRA